MTGQLDTCLGLIKQFIRCPICLDDVKNPVVTTCTHIYCRFCINEHIGKKRNFACPLCNKKLNSRSVKLSNKITNVFDICKQLIISYEEEMKASDKKPLPRTRILLGTAAKTRHAKRKEAGDLSKNAENSINDSLLTQPMVDVSQNHGLNNNDLKNDELLDLFAMTQSTQPMRDCPDSESLFVSVEGMRHDINHFGGEVLKSSLNFKAHTKNRSKVNTGFSRSKTFKALPPLPPTVRSSKVYPTSSQVDKNINGFRTKNLKRCASANVRHELTRKNLRRTSNTSVISNPVLVTKTHEVVCHVEPSNRKAILRSNQNQLESISDKILAVPVNSSCVDHCAIKKSKSFVARSNVSAPSFLAGKRLLRKYNLKRTRLSECSYKSNSSNSFKSPGWSRWKQMCNDLRRRSSSLRLTFGKRMKSNKRSKSNSPSVGSCKFSNGPPTRSASLSSRMGLSFSRWGISGSRRNRYEEKQNSQKNSLVPEIQQDCSLHVDPVRDTVYETPIFLNSEHFKNTQKTGENCRFIMPLKRLSREYLHSRSGRLHLRASFLNESLHSSTMENYHSPKQQILKEIFSTPKSGVQLNHSNMTDSNLMVSCTELYYQPVHCSACGETLILDSSSFHASPSQFSLNRNFQRSERCSMSSSYWQAEDPGDDMQACVYSSDCRGSVQSFGLENVCQLTNTVQNFESYVPTQASEHGSPNTKKLNFAVVNNVDTHMHEGDNIESVSVVNESIDDHVQHERLNTECEELEAVVVALQEQLEAQADKFDLHNANNFIESTETELLCSDFVGPSPVSSMEQQRDSAVNDNDDEELVRPYDDTLILGKDDPVELIPETCASENVEMIPSSQTDEDLELDLITEISNTNDSLDKMAFTNLQYLTKSKVNVPSTFDRVDASQPSILTTSCLDQLISSPINQSNMSSLLLSTDQSCSTVTPCPESCINYLRPNNESISTFDLLKSKKMETKTKVIKLTGSGLNPDDIVMLKRFCAKFGVVECSRFISGQTTHVVIKEKSGSPRVVTRTLKYFMGILNRAWIINTQWIHQCLALGQLVDESPYEIEGDIVCGDCHEGPKRSRLGLSALGQSMVNRIPLHDRSNQLGIDQSVDDCRPFVGLWLCAFDSLGALELSDFVQLATDGGATRVFENANQLMDAASSEFSASLLGKINNLQKPKAIVLTSLDGKSKTHLEKCQKLYRSHGIPIINIDWMLNCISLYRRLPISQVYRICPTPTPVSVKIGK